ncbi:MAG: apolipoprotein N-acyltransferase [Rhodospirillaceae bacterium]
MPNKRVYFKAAAFGALATLAMPPVYAVPLLLIAVPGLLRLLDGATDRKQAFLLGWWFGFAHFVLGLYWISFALLVDIGKFWWLMPAAIAGLPAVLALFIGLVTLASRALGLRGLSRIVGFAVIWTAVELLRGHVFTGFPWLLVGYGWVAWTPVLQTVAITGIYGLSLLTMLVAGLPAAFFDPEVPRRRAIAALAAGLLLFVGLAGIGSWRLAHADHDTVPGVRLRLVQANIDQRLKWAPGERDANFRAQLALSTQAPLAGTARPTAIIWPETAVTFFVALDPGRRNALAAAAPAGGLVLTGAPRGRLKPDHTPEFWNSLTVVDPTGRIIADYDKFHLVPFGEYIPGRALIPSWLPLVGVATDGGSDFSAGPGPRTLRLPGLPPVSPLICYEVIFPGAVTDPADRPEWLLNLTNDAWYGHTAGPHQHFAIALTRAVEEGLPLVRVANTGISGVVDSYGRTVARLELGEKGVLDADLPRALARPTFYARYGNGPIILLLSAIGLFLLRQRFRT